MDVAAQERAMHLIGQFSDRMTRVVDAAFGTEWAEIEDILAIAAIVHEGSVTTRRLSEMSGLDRRATSRTVSRMKSEGVVDTRPASQDRRAVAVVLTRDGQRHADELRRSLVQFFVDASQISGEIHRGLAPDRNSLQTEGAATADATELLIRTCEAGIALVRAMPPSAVEGRLAGRQRAALVQIARSPGTRPAELSAALQVSRSGASYIVDQLHAKGLIFRTRGKVPHDGRAVVLEATPAGFAAVMAVAAEIEKQREPLADLFAEIEAWAPSRDEFATTSAVIHTRK